MRRVRHLPLLPQESSMEHSMTDHVPSGARRAGPFAWYATLSKNEKRTFWSCKIGYGLDGMDTQMLSFVIPTLIATWGISKGEAGLIGTSTLLASAAGGWIAGILSDRIGRVRTLQLTVLWFAFFTFMCGLAQNYDQLLVARTLMGFGFGGEWTAGAVLIGEVIRSQDRGKAVGLVPALFVLVIRRLVKESDTFEQARDERLSQAEKPSPWAFFEIFAPRMLSTTLRASLLTTGALGGYYAITTWLPTYLKTERGLSVLGTGGYLAMVIVGSYVGYVISALLTDAIGRKKNFILFAVGSMSIVLAYTQLPIDNTWMLWLGFPLGFFASGIFAGMGAFLTELFPTRMRGSGQGFCYNAGRSIAALFPLFIGALSETLPIGVGIGVFAAGAYAVVILAALSLPETRGRQLES